MWSKNTKYMLHTIWIWYFVFSSLHWYILIYSTRLVFCRILSTWLYLHWQYRWMKLPFNKSAWNYPIIQGRSTNHDSCIMKRITMIDSKHGRLSFCDSYLTTTLYANPSISVFIDGVFPLEFKAKIKSCSSISDHKLRTISNFTLCWFSELLICSARGYLIYIEWHAYTTTSNVGSCFAHAKDFCFNYHYAPSPSKDISGSNQNAFFI